MYKICVFLCVVKTTLILGLDPRCAVDVLLPSSLLSFPGGTYHLACGSSVHLPHFCYSSVRLLIHLLISPNEIMNIKTNSSKLCQWPMAPKSNCPRPLDFRCEVMLMCAAFCFGQNFVTNSFQHFSKVAPTVCLKFMFERCN